MPFFLWLRGITANKLLELHRHHLGTQMRDVGREVSLYRGTLPETTSAALAAQLLGHVTRPSEAAHQPQICSQTRFNLPFSIRARRLPLVASMRMLHPL